MRYLSVCSGIEAATVAWHPLGWEAVAFSEIEKFPRAVLAHHYPEVLLLGDFREIRGDEFGAIDVLVAGTPCQDFSIAGLRAGFAGARGNLTLQFLRLAARVRPRWIIWENVPGVLSHHQGRTFGTILGALGQLGFGFAYRVLDAQYAGLAQRRERVLLVGCAGDWRRAAAVLFELESLRWNPPPRRSSRQDIARPVAGGSPGSGGYRHDADTADSLVAGAIDGSAGGADENDARDGRLTVATLDASYGRLQGCDGQALNHGHSHLIAFGGNNTAGPIDVATAVNAHGGPRGRLDFETETFVAFVQNSRSEVRAVSGDGRIVGALAGDHGVQQQNYIAFDAKAGGKTSFTIGDVPGSLRGDGHGGGHAAVAFTMRTRNGVNQAEPSGDMAACLGAAHGDSSRQYVAALGVRRLMPEECEILQGFPPGYTAIPYPRKRIAVDGPRYRAIGNAMPVPIMRWIGERIDMVERLS